MPNTATRITVRHGDRNFGPYGLDEVNRLLVEGRLSRDDLAWVEGAPEWTRLGLVPGTAAVPPAPPSAMVLDDGELVSDRLVLPAFLLAFFVGTFGVHRFYVGKTGSGVAQLLTLGGCGIWALIDLIMIVMGKFADNEGNFIKL